MDDAAPTIPNDPTELTPAWLTQALADAGAIRDSVITALQTEVIGADRGFTGQVARLQLTYDRHEPGQPATLIAKFPMAERPDSTFRETQQIQSYWDRCAREVRFYRQIAVTAGCTARVYGSWDDAANWRMLLLLEDLSASQPGDALLGCTVDQAAEVIEQLAPFHARWWGRTDEPDLAWLPRWGSQPQAMAERFRQQLPLVIERNGERRPSAIRRMAPDLIDRYPSTLERLTQRPTTIVHGDLHLDNLMFSSDRGVVILDWQGVAIGPAIVDLGTFLVGSLSSADLSASEMDLLRRYHDLLITHGVTDYPLADLIEDYRHSLIWQLAGITGWLVRVDPTLAGRERALVDALFEPGLVVAAVMRGLVTRDA